MANYLDKDGLIYVWSKIKSLVATKVDKVDGKGLSTNDFTTDYKTKLDGISAGANKITVDVELSSTSTNPVQNKAVKTALDDKIGTTKFETLLGRVNDLYDTKADLDIATTTTNGLMSKDDKVKLDGIAAGANKTVVDSELSDTSTNPVENKAVNTALANKVDKESGKGLSTNDFTTAEKNKLGTVEENANYIEVDTLPNASSNNPLSNAGFVQALNDTFLELTKTASSTTNGLMSKTDKAKLDAFSSASEYAKKTDLASVYKYKGSKATKSALPTTGNTVGDVWNVESDDMNYAWDGSKWDSLGGSFNVTSITNAEIDTITSE